MRYIWIDNSVFEKKFKDIEGFTVKVVKDKMFGGVFHKYFYNGKRVEYYSNDKSTNQIVLSTAIYGMLSKRKIYTEVARI